MKRTTVYLEPDIEMLLEREMRRRKQPMAELIREAVREYLTRDAPVGPPGAGAFKSRRKDTAADVDRALTETGFGESR